MRELTEQQQEAKDSAGQRTFWLFDVSLKESGDYPAEALYFSTQPVLYNENLYEPRLRSKPQIKNTLGDRFGFRVGI
jgi:hypothetical protein